MRQLNVALAFGLLASACSSHTSPPGTAPAAARAPAARDLGDGPSESQLRKFMERQNEALEQMRRDPKLAPQLPPFHVKIHELHKDKCVPMAASPGKMECGVDMKVTMWPVGGYESGEPLADSKSLHVTLNARGDWVDCMVGPEVEPACKY